MIPMTNIETLRKKYASDNFMAFSIDVDWASEACIEKILDFFLVRNIPLTIFCTHPSEALERCRNNPLVERGIHPNFCVGSSQGESMDQVIDYCMNIVPEARCVRGHRWFSSNDMYDRLVERGFAFDSNESSMLDPVLPYIHRSGMLRIPVFFEDGGFLWSGEELDFETNGKKYFDTTGLKVLDLHPIHFALNCPTQDFYRHVGDSIPRQEYTAMNAQTIDKLEYKGIGMRNYLMELVNFVEKTAVNVVSLGQIYEELEIEKE